MSKQKRLSKEYQRKLQGYEKKPLFTFAEITESLKQSYMESFKKMLNQDFMSIFETERMAQEKMIDDYMKVTHPFRYKWVNRFKGSRHRLIRVKAAKWLMRSFRTEEETLSDGTRVFKLCKGDTTLRQIEFVPRTIEFKRYSSIPDDSQLKGFDNNMQGYWKSEDGTINCRDTLCPHGFDKNDGRGCAECDLDDYMQGYSEHKESKEQKPTPFKRWNEVTQSYTHGYRMEEDEDSLPKNGERKFPQR